MTPSAIEGRRLDQIVADSARLFDLPLNSVLSGGRTDRLARARFAAAWAMREGRGTSLKHITLTLHRKCHTVAINALARAEQLRANDPNFREITDRLLAADRRRK